MKIEKIKEHFGARITDVDITTFTKNDRQFLVDLLGKYRVVIIDGHKKLTPQEVVEHCEIYSTIWTNDGEGYLVGNSEEPSAHPETNKITLVSNKGMGVLGDGEVPWHQDISHKPWDSPGGTMPERLLYCAVSADDEVSRTSWFDFTYVYDNCPIPLRNRLETVKVKHYAPYPTSWKCNIAPLVLVDPYTGKKGICANRGFIKEYIDIDPEEAKDIQAQILEIATRSENVIIHDWKVGDMVICNNFMTSHKRERLISKEERTVWRVTFQIPELIPKEIYPEILFEN
jgi:alpha-ketoglutarate-dependent taurine dioxygenase